MENKSDKFLLEGIRIIDAASFIAGPSAATIMGDFGAEVIKISAELIRSISILWALSFFKSKETLFLFLEVSCQQ